MTRNSVTKTFNLFLYSRNWLK